MSALSPKSSATRSRNFATCGLWRCASSSSRDAQRSTNASRRGSSAPRWNPLLLRTDRAWYVLDRVGGAPVSSRINHVSINARDLQESVEFYVDLLGAEPIDTPNFGIPVQWLALGRTQLHLFEKDLQPTSHHHLGITVDDLARAYRAADRRGAFDDEA